MQACCVKCEIVELCGCENVFAQSRIYFAAQRFANDALEIWQIYCIDQYYFPCMDFVQSIHNVKIVELHICLRIHIYTIAYIAILKGGESFILYVKKIYLLERTRNIMKDHFRGYRSEG